MLLRKLSTSKYDTEEKEYTTSSDHEHNNIGRTVKTSLLRIGITFQAANDRNAATDWNVVKGHTKRKRIR